MAGGQCCGGRASQVRTGNTGSSARGCKRCLCGHVVHMMLCQTMSAADSVAGRTLFRHEHSPLLVWFVHKTLPALTWWQTRNSPPCATCLMYAIPSSMMSYASAAPGRKGLVGLAPAVVVAALKTACRLSAADASPFSILVNRLLCLKSDLHACMHAHAQQRAWFTQHT